MGNASTLLARRRIPRLRRLAPLVLAMWVNACVSWRPVELSPTRAFLPNEEVRIVRGDDRATVLVAARVVGDSLLGQRAPRGTRVAAPLADIRRAELLSVDKGRTAVAVGVVVVGLAIAIAIAVSNMQIGLGDAPVF